MGCGCLWSTEWVWLHCAVSPEGTSRKSSEEVVGPDRGPGDSGGGQRVGSQGEGSRDAELPGGSPGARSEPAGGRAGGRACLLNPGRPRGGGEAAGHRRGDSQVEEGRELVTRTS